MKIRLFLPIFSVVSLPAAQPSRPPTDPYPVVRWSFQAEGSIFGDPVAGPDGTLYLASAGGVLYSLTPDGKVRWTYRTGDRFFAGPTLAPNGRLYIGGLTGTVYCLTSEGRLVWQASATGPAECRIVAPPAVDSLGRSFVVSWDDRVYGFDPGGALLWTGTAAGHPSAPLILDSRGFLYLAALSPQDPSRLLLQRMAPGWLQVLWRSSHPLWIDRNRVTAAPVLDEVRGRLYAAASRDSDGILLEVEARTGRIIREHWFPKGLVATPALAPGGILLVPCLDGRLYALDPAGGTVAWVFQARAPYLAGSPRVTDLGDILFADTDGTVYALDAQGNERWSFPGESAVWSRPTVAADGSVLVATSGGRLHALGHGDSFCFPHFGDGTADGIRLQTRFEFVNLGQDAEVVMDFLDPEGHPIQASLGTGLIGHRHRRLLPRGQVWTAETAGDGPLTTGWVRVTAGPGIRGTAVFRYSEGGQILCESGVPAAEPLTAFTLPARRTGPLSGTGLAVANPGMETAQLELVFHPGNAPEAVLRRRLELPPGGRLAQYLWEIFPALGSRQPVGGLLQVQSDREVAAVTLRQTIDLARPYPASVPTLTTFPVIPADPQPGLEEVRLLFPQTVHGSSGVLSVASELSLINPSLQAGVSGRIEFFTPGGEPDRLDLDPLGSGSSFFFDLPPTTALVARTRHSGSLKAGYARLTGDPPLAGVEVLQGRIGDVTVYEAGVPVAQPLQDFTLLVPESGLTGLALVNTGTGPAQVLLRLYDRTFHLQASGGLPAEVPPGEHLAKFLPELFPGLGPGFTGGILTVQSDQPLAALTLVQHGNPEDFPAQVYRLTVYPVIPGRPD